VLDTVMLAAILTLQASAPQTARVTGRLVEEGPSTPIGDARIVLTAAVPPPPPSPGGPPQIPSFLGATDADGRFSIERLPAGTYRIQAQKAGFTLNPDSTTQTFLRLDVAEARDIGTMTLRRGGVVAGRVLGPSGQPMAEARVVVIATQSDMPGIAYNGVAMRGNILTNDLGEFRAYGLQPGAYYVYAAPPAEANAGLMVGTSTRATAMATTFYPRGLDRADARIVSVAAGQTTSGIEIRIVEAPAYHVSGVVVDEAGAAVPNAMVFANIMTLGGSMGPFDAPRRTQTDEQGRFTLTGMTPGAYNVNASIPFRPPTAVGAVSSPGAISGTVTGIVTSSVVAVPSGATIPSQARVTITDGNVADLRIVVRRPQLR
jgi:protocatechuate 3,4-dioxygenase beta subunit